ncbi:MAG: DUF6588 family protein [Bacteroidota bacterium]
MNKLRGCSRPFLTVGALCAFLVAAESGLAQGDVEKALQQFSADAVKGYVQPIGDLFGANLNAGFFRGAAIEKAGFHIRLDIVGMASMVGDKQKTYTAQAPPGFTPATFETATIFGGTGTTITDQSTLLSYRGSDGVFNTSFFPTAAPQVTVGDLYGTRAAVRFIATPEVGGLPKATLWGIGAQHSVSQYLPDVPLDVAAHVFYSKFTFGDLIDVSALSIGADASKSFSILTLYGGLAWEQSTMKISYTPTVAGLAPVSIDLDGANNFRFLVGLNLGLGVFHIFGDANFGSVTNFSAGIGFGN